MGYTGEKKRAYAREWKAARRAAALIGASCSYCGSTSNLELDHIDRSTKVDHKIWSWSKVRRDAELAKCQWLCKPCHKQKSDDEMRTPMPPCGERRTYERGCRCALCRSANTAYQQRRRTARDTKV